MRRRNEAIERSRTSSAVSAVTSVRRPRCFCGAGLAVVFGGSGGADGAARTATDLARTFILVGGVGGDTGGARGGRRGSLGRGGGLGLGFAETLLGFEFGLALGFLVLAVALFLGLAAGFGGFALGLLDAFLGVAALGFLFRQPAFLDVADLGVGQRAGARGTLVLGQGTQHHAGTAARRGRRGGTGQRRGPGGRRGLGNDRLRRVRRFGWPHRRRCGACHASRPPPAWSGRG